MIDGVNVYTDENGFVLALGGDVVEEAIRYVNDPDSCTLELRLSQHAVLELLAAIRGTVEPWANEMERERVAYERATPEERARVLGSRLLGFEE